MWQTHFSDKSSEFWNISGQKSFQIRDCKVVVVISEVAVTNFSLIVFKFCVLDNVQIGLQDIILKQNFKNSQKTFTVFFFSFLVNFGTA